MLLRRKVERAHFYFYRNLHFLSFDRSIQCYRNDKLLWQEDVNDWVWDIVGHDNRLWVITSCSTLLNIDLSTLRRRYFSRFEVPAKLSRMLVCNNKLYIRHYDSLIGYDSFIVWDGEKFNHVKCPVSISSCLYSNGEVIVCRGGDNLIIWNPKNNTTKVTFFDKFIKSAVDDEVICERQYLSDHKEFNTPANRYNYQTKTWHKLHGWQDSPVNYRVALSAEELLEFSQGKIQVKTPSSMCWIQDQTLYVTDNSFVYILRKPGLEYFSLLPEKEQQLIKTLWLLNHRLHFCCKDIAHLISLLIL